MKRWIVALLLLGCSKPAPPVHEPPYVKVAKPVVCDVPIYRSYVGHVEPNLSVEIKPQVSGILTGQYFAEGQEVCEKSLLVTIDPRPFQAALEKAQGELAQNKALLQQAQESAHRYQALATLHYIAPLDYDQLLTQALSYEAAVLQSKAAVEQAQINLDYCTIQAPFRGVASRLQINVGSYVAAGSETPLLTINQIKPIRVSFYVPEHDLRAIAHLQAQTPLKASVIRAGQMIEGSLFFIDNRVDETTGMILLQALFSNQEQELWPGEFVDVRLILQIEKEAIVIPSQAVSMGQQGPYLYVLKPDQTVELRIIQPGQKEGPSIVVEKGIGAEDTVIVEGQLNLKPGDRVQVR